MRPAAARLAALTAEIARLEGSTVGAAHRIEDMRRELAALQADLATAGGHPSPHPSPDTRSGQGPDDDPDGDLFDDVPV